jgi:ABC-type proline/glycine betaine transport system ATPase subunit
VQKDFGITAVFVTHDIEEAIYLADRIAVLGMGLNPG